MLEGTISASEHILSSNNEFRFLISRYVESVTDFLLKNYLQNSFHNGVDDRTKLSRLLISNI